MRAEERRARNEALFRDLNERVREVDERIEKETGSRGDVEFLCECSNLDCATRFRMARAQYEAVRAHPSRFIVVPEHVNERMERVVGRHSDFVIVEKEGKASDIARESDPRG